MAAIVSGFPIVQVILNAMDPNQMLNSIAFE